VVVKTFDFQCNHERSDIQNPDGNAKPPSQSSEGGDLREVQVHIPVSVSHSCVTASLGSLTNTLTLTGG
jgi:hypothetical protein